MTSPGAGQDIGEQANKSKAKEDRPFRKSRQTAVLFFVAQGAADHFHVSINTIRDYIRSIYDRSHVHSKTKAVRTAPKSRIIT